MSTTKVTAEFAKTEVASLQEQAAYHKRQVRKHRAELNQAMSELERLRREFAAQLGIEVVVVPQAHSQEAESNAHHAKP